MLFLQLSSFSTSLCSNQQLCSDSLDAVFNCGVSSRSAGSLENDQADTESQCVSITLSTLLRWVIFIFIHQHMGCPGHPIKVLGGQTIPYMDVKMYNK